MKLTMLFLTLVLLQVSAATKAQITLNEKNVPLQKALKAISKQSGYDFIYTDQDLTAALPVSLALNNATIELALQQAFEKQPLQYRIEDKTVMVKKKDGPSFPDQVKAVFAAIDVHGTVLDEKGQPLPGVTVKVKGGNKATITDVKGGFDLKNVNEDAVLQISFIGFVTKEISVKDNITAIVLNLSESKLDEVQVEAYRITSPRLSTGNVTTITSKDIQKNPVSNPLLALSGRVAGLNITQANGLSGSAVTAVIQGQNSIHSGNDPFYVIDGVPYTSQLLPNLGGMLGTSGINGNGSPSGQGSPLSFINPNDIESISILKDADATAIYGSRAANGAILITTKKGIAGETMINLDFQQGLGQVAHKLPLMNTSQYLNMRNEAFNNDKRIPSADITSPDFAPDLAIWGKNSSTDWQKYFIGNSSKYTNLNATISGGSDHTQFFIGGTFHRETTVFPGNFSDKKGSLHFNINNTSKNKNFSIQLSGSYLADQNFLPGSDLTSKAISLEPNAPNLRNSDGSLNWMVNSSGASLFSNPLAEFEIKYKPITKNLTSNMTLGYKILPGLDIKGNLGYTNMQVNEFFGYPLSYWSPDMRPYVPRVAVYVNNSTNSWIAEPQINYSKRFSFGHIDALLGATFLQNNANGYSVLGRGYSTDEVLEDLNSAVSLQPNGASRSTYKYNAFFGRIAYNLKDRYLLTLTARRDGSSRFGSENRFHNFGAVSTAWIFSEEKLLKDNVSFLSFGKLKFSYGTTGNDQIPDYSYLSLFDPYNVEISYQNGASLIPRNLSNPYLQWEETTKMNFGLDLGFVNDRISLNFNYYRNRSSNQLLPSSLPSQTGFNSIILNLPATVQNQGLELSIQSINIKSGAFRWSSNINITIPRNKLLRYDGLEISNDRDQLVVGQPLGILKVYNFDGVNPITGIYSFIDAQGLKTSTPDYSKDRTQIVNTAPKMYGGVTNTISVKGFSLDILISFVKQTGRNYKFNNVMPGTGLFGNQSTAVLNRWRKIGDIAEYQRFNSDYSANEAFSAAGLSNAAYSDASYIRVKNVSLSYQLPKSILDKAHLKSVKVYLLGQNLATLTNYIGLDPESLSISSLPPLRVWTAGLQLGL